MATAVYVAVEVIDNEYISQKCPEFLEMFVYPALYYCSYARQDVFIARTQCTDLIDFTQYSLLEVKEKWRFCWR